MFCTNSGRSACRRPAILSHVSTLVNLANCTKNELKFQLIFLTALLLRFSQAPATLRLQKTPCMRSLLFSILMTSWLLTALPSSCTLLLLMLKGNTLRLLKNTLYHFLSLLYTFIILPFGLFVKYFFLKFKTFLFSAFLANTNNFMLFKIFCASRD